MKVLFTFLKILHSSPNLIENDHILCLLTIKYQLSNTLSHVDLKKSRKAEYSRTLFFEWATGGLFVHPLFLLPSWFTWFIDDPKKVLFWVGKYGSRGFDGGLRFFGVFQTLSLRYKYLLTWVATLQHVLVSWLLLGGFNGCLSGMGFRLIRITSWTKDTGKRPDDF